MPPLGYRPVPTDRATDVRPDTGPVPKPSIFSRRTQRALCLACLAFILYGTLGPLRNTPEPWLRLSDQWTYLPAAGHTDRNDVITNFAVYVPVGLALRLLVRRRGRAGLLDLGVGLALAVILSYTTEFLQQFMPGRSASRTDIYVNACGALVGALLAVRWQAALRQLHTLLFFHLRARNSLWTTMTVAAIVAALFVMTWPWTVKRPVITLGFDEPLCLADPLRYWRLATFILVGYLLTGRGIVRWRKRAPAMARTVFRVALFAGTLELAQAVLGEHVSSILQATIATAGAAGGALLAALVVKPTEPARQPPSRCPANGRRPPMLSATVHRLALGTLVTTLAVVVLASLWTTVPHGVLRAEPDFRWIPFQAHYSANFLLAVFEMLQQCTLYAFVTVTCLLLTGGRGRVTPLLLLLGTVATIEICQAFLAGHSGDTTALILATATWAITTRIWRSFYPDRPAPTPPPPAAAQTR